MSTAPGVLVKIEPSGSAPIAGVGTSTAGFLLEVALDETRGDQPFVVPDRPGLVTSYEQFVREYLLNPGEKTPGELGDRLKRAAAAVHGFFLNGGTRCHVTFYADKNGWDSALARLEKLDEVSLMVAPAADDQRQAELAQRCAAVGDRFAVLDGPADRVTTFKRPGEPGGAGRDLPVVSDYAAYYYPWIDVVNPIDGRRGAQPPSGHVAGVYARVDGSRGVHKAPANEEIRGALGVAFSLSSERIGDMNDRGVNAIRMVQGSVRIWGARTLGGDVNGGTKYVNVRRTLLFLRESIEEGLQWVVFEPNNHTLWGRVRRNIGAFLHDVWASGALFGTTAEDAYYVTCNEELNPPSMRDNGQLNVEVGVALVKPAEFVTITIRQWSGPGQ